MEGRSKGFPQSRLESALRGRELRAALNTKSAREGLRPEARRCHAQHDGFTLIDLMAVTAVVAFGALLTIPAFAKGGPIGQGLQCLNNLKQLTVAWSMYANDNNDRLV